MAPLALPWDKEIGAAVLAAVRNEQTAIEAATGRPSVDLAFAEADLALVYECDRPVVGEQARECELRVIDRRRLQIQREESARDASSSPGEVRTHPSSVESGASRGASSPHSSSPTSDAKEAPPSGGGYVGDPIYPDDRFQAATP